MKLRDSVQTAIVLALAAGTALACPNHTAARSTAVLTLPPSHAAVVAWKPRAWTPAAATPGFVVSIDPVDGALGMPAANEFGPYAPIGDEAPVATYRRADGSVRAALDDRFAEFAVVTLGADGKPAWTCVHGTNGAAQFMKRPVVNSNPAQTPGTVWEEK
jgi:hypothetical protein